MAKYTGLEISATRELSLKTLSLNLKFRASACSNLNQFKKLFFGRARQIQTTTALFTYAKIQPDTDIKFRPDIILYWRIEYRAKWVLHPFCLPKSPAPLTLSYNNIELIFLNIGVALNIDTCEQGLTSWQSDLQWTVRLLPYLPPLKVRITWWIFPLCVKMVTRVQAAILMQIMFDVLKVATVQWQT